jgi:sugar lactone lactonase YvrE
MNKRIKNQAFLLLAVALFSCSSVNKPPGQVEDTVPVLFSSPFNFEVSKNKGATITVNINFSEENKLKVKANSSGNGVGSIADIKSYQVYLLRISASNGYPFREPLQDAVGNPFVTNVSYPANIVIKLVNVPGSSAQGQYYYVAVRAWSGNDASGIELFKPNTFLFNSPRIFISSGNGISVDSATLVAANTATLTITAGLIDAAGAKLENIINVNSGSATIPSISYSSIPVFTSIVAGMSGSFSALDTGIATTSQLNIPRGVTADSSGNFYIADTNNNLIRKVTTSGAISTIAGGGILNDGIATNTQLNSPFGVAVDNSGNVYIADTTNNIIRKVTTAGAISTIAGGGSLNDGIATNTQLITPRGVAADSSGNIYIADTGNHNIRKVTPAGAISTIAGGGSLNDGIATNTQLSSPSGIAADSNGNIYIADSGNQVIRKVTPAGSINTIAGTLGSTGGPFTQNLNNPSGVAVDGNGNVYIADTNNHVIKKVNSVGAISTIVGGGSSPSTNPLLTQLNTPFGVAVDSKGYIYIANTNDHTIRKVF